MISVLVLGCRPAAFHAVPPGEVVRTLAALVPAIIGGVVRDVTLIAPRESAGLSQVADHAGCTLSEADTFAAAIAQGARHARCGIVMVARAGMTLDRGFIDEIAGLLPTVTAEGLHPRRLKAESVGFAARVFPVLASDAALLVPRDRLLTCGATDFRHLVRLTRPRRRLNSRAWLTT